MFYWHTLLNWCFRLNRAITNFCGNCSSVEQRRIQPHGCVRVARNKLITITKSLTPGKSATCDMSPCVSISIAFREIIYSYKFRLYLVDNSGYLLPDKSWTSLTLSYAILFGLWIYVLADILLLIKVFSKPTSIDQRVLCLLWTMAYLLFVSFATHSFFKRTEISNFINRFFTLDRSLRGIKILHWSICIISVMLSLWLWCFKLQTNVLFLQLGMDTDYIKGRRQQRISWPRSFVCRLGMAVLC